MAHKKTLLETKLCLICEKPFAWRKKWRDCWNEVKYCSERCRRNKSNKNKENMHMENKHIENKNA